MCHRRSGHNFQTNAWAQDQCDFSLTGRSIILLIRFSVMDGRTDWKVENFETTMKLIIPFQRCLGLIIVNTETSGKATKDDRVYKVILSYINVPLISNIFQLSSYIVPFSSDNIPLSSENVWLSSNNDSCSSDNVHISFEDVPLSSSNVPLNFNNVL